MKTLRSVLASFLLLAGSWVGAADGLIAIKSPYGAQQTMNRFED